MKGGKYAKTPAKIQVRRIFQIRDIGRNVLPIFIEIGMETPCWYSLGHLDELQPADGNQQKHLLPSFATKSVKLFFEVLINIKVILFLMHELFR